jgi:hypothetical protein
MTDKQVKRIFVLILCVFNYGDTIAFTSTPFGMVRQTNVWANPSASSLKTPLTMTGADDELNPSTFREAEVLGLKYMQERKYKEALDGTANDMLQISYAFNQCSKKISLLLIPNNHIYFKCLTFLYFYDLISVQNRNDIAGKSNRYNKDEIIIWSITGWW